MRVSGRLASSLTMTVGFVLPVCFLEPSWKWLGWGRSRAPCVRSRQRMPKPQGNMRCGANGVSWETDRRCSGQSCLQGPTALFGAVRAMRYRGQQPAPTSQRPPLPTPTETNGDIPLRPQEPWGRPSAPETRPVYGRHRLPLPGSKQPVDPSGQALSRICPLCRRPVAAGCPGHLLDCPHILQSLLPLQVISSVLLSCPLCLSLIKGHLSLD